MQFVGWLLKLLTARMTEIRSKLIWITESVYSSRSLIHEISVEQATQLKSIPRGLHARRVTSPFDFGDQETVGCCLKTDPRGKKQQFGTYAGIHQIGYVVIVVTCDGVVLSGEVFATLQELQMRWMAD